MHNVMSMTLQKYTIEPLIGVGPIKLGMNRNDVQNIMPEASKQFMKTRNSSVETDAFHKNCFQVFYNHQTVCVEYIELSRRCPFIADIFGVDPFGSLAEELIQYLSEKAKFDKSDPELGYSYIFPEIELSVWRPSIEDKHFSTIGIGVKGYYSNKDS